ncbi:MAG: chromate transporter [Erysipelotrichaceae bacterium]|nr:chromate transporter [Erysipelotrichaceae bacterium]
MNKLKKYWTLFTTFLKISMFTFGGGYAMIPLIQTEVVEKKGWLRSDEIFSIIVISESTPGPISVNCATYVGTKVAGFWGAFFATLGLITPPFVIISIIAYFYNDFMAFAPIQAMFKGIQAGVVILIFHAAVKLSLKMDKGYFALILFAVTVILQILINIYAIQFSSVYFILTGLLLGLLYYGLLANLRGGKSK